MPKNYAARIILGTACCSGGKRPLSIFLASNSGHYYKFVLATPSRIRESGMLTKFLNFVFTKIGDGSNLARRWMEQPGRRWMDGMLQRWSEEDGQDGILKMARWKIGHGQLYIFY
jgi:hypothetical protein